MWMNEPQAGWTPFRKWVKSDEKMDAAIDVSTLKITNEILRLIADIDEFKGIWQAIGRIAPERLSRLRRVATIESIGSSTRIEGAVLSDREVERLLSGAEVESFATRDEQEVAGYAGAMETVFESWKAIDLAENHIKQLHRDLLKYSTRDERHRGEYKTLPNHVEAFDHAGESPGVIFHTASPFDTPRKMTELTAHTRLSLERGDLHPLLAIAVFIVVFLEIHPFQDGNGRLSRILTTLLLLRAGYAYVPYGLESVVEQSKEDYYLALRRTQGTIRSGAPDWQPWVTWFLKALRRQKNRLARKIEHERIVAGALPDLSARILDFARDHGRVTVADAVQATGASRNTVKDHVRTLARAGHLARHGAGRGTWYAPG